MKNFSLSYTYTFFMGAFFHGGTRLLLYPFQNLLNRPLFLPLETFFFYGDFLPDDFHSYWSIYMLLFFIFFFLSCIKGKLICLEDRVSYAFFSLGVYSFVPFFFPLLVYLLSQKMDLFLKVFSFEYGPMAYLNKVWILFFSLYFLYKKKGKSIKAK